MHGFRSSSSLLVNAEVDSMGGVIDGGVGIGTRTSPHQAAIEKAQAELRLEYDVHEERSRELEFLEKGGNPLDFKFGYAASASVHSTSLTHQRPNQFVTSDGKGSFALTASPRGDSVESSGRLGVAVEPNSADNFHGENELLESGRKSVYPSRSNVTPSEHSSQLDVSLNAKGSEDSPIFHPKKGQAYRRRNRSRTSRDGTRSSSTDVASRAGHGPSFPGRHGLFAKTVNSENRIDKELDGAGAIDSSTNLADAGMVEGKVVVSANKFLWDESLKVDGSSFGITTGEPDSVRGKEQVVPAGIACPPAEKTENHGSPLEQNEPNKFTGDVKCTPIDGLTMKGLDSESSCTQTSLSIDGNGNIDSDLCTNLKNIDSNSAMEGQKLLCEEMPNTKDEKKLKESVINAIESGFSTGSSLNSIVQNHKGNVFPEREEKEINDGRSSRQNEAKCPSIAEEKEPNNRIDSNLHVKEDSMDVRSMKLENLCTEKLKASRDGFLHGPAETDLSASRPSPELQICSEHQLKVVNKGEEDRILEEARIIEAKRKRIAELSVHSVPTEYRKKSHWDFVVEEMAWLANDFAQERVWKMTAASQICQWVASASRSRLDDRIKYRKLKTVAHTLAKAVMEFWHSAEQLLEDDGINCGLENCKYDVAASRRTNEIGASGDSIGSPDEGVKCHRKNVQAVQEYAVRFLRYNFSVKPHVKLEASEISDQALGMDITDLSWQDHFTEENLFYIVPLGAMEAYRKSIESYLVQREGMHNNMQQNAATPIYNVAAEFGSQDNEYEEDEGDNVLYQPGAFEGSRPLKVVQKRRKNLKSYAARSYELGGDFAYGHCVEDRIGTPQSGLLGKRSTNSLNVGPIPIKRMRTASRHRIGGLFSAGAAGGVPHPSRTDASSGDTNSFQDDHSTLHGGSIVVKGSEVESGIDFNKHAMLDPTVFSAKPKKKKKSKHQGPYDQRWQVDSAVQNELRGDHLKKRFDSHQYESNGSCGLYGHQSKKSKIMKQSDNSFENTTPMSGSITSPVTSQMSNMSNPNKLIKLIGGRDRGRKAKLFKVPSGQPGSGSPWSLFEDQALVVLVHDMGPNWELVSDAINSTLQLKCIFRKPNECKERHKILMDRNSGDGADSAEDSGSSQPYPSTLPGIPKGSARQLFQRLQGPMEEDTIKSHFEKIILIGQQLHYWKKQNDNQDPKQLAPIHGSHVAALSQVIPNNANGVVLTPLDLCDTSASSPDVFSLGCQGPHTGGFASSNQNVIPSILPPGANSSVQGSPCMGIGSSLTAPSSQLNGSVRDGRCGVPRTTSLPIDEQQRIQQYNPMLSNRSIQQSNLSIPGGFSGTDQSARMLSGGNGVGMMSGMNRNMPMRRPGLQGIASSTMLNPGALVTPNMGGLPGAVNMNPGAGPSQGNSILRPRDALRMVRPSQNQEHQRQIMLPEMQMQVTHSNSQGVPPFGGLSSAFPNQSPSPPGQTYPVHQQPHQVPAQHSNIIGNPHLLGSPHPATAEQQAYALQLARERQLRQQMLRQQQQRQQLPASSALMSHVQPQSQLPISSSLQNSSQIQVQAVSQPVSLPPLTPTSSMTPGSSQIQQKHQLPPQGLGRTLQGASGMMNQNGTQRQRQPQQVQQHFQQSGRHYPQQRQQSQALQQAKLLKGMGRGNMLVHQNLAPDPSHFNGLSSNCVNQVMEKGEQSMHLMQGRGLCSGSGINSVQQSKGLVQPQPAGQSQSQQKPYSSSAPMSSKQCQQLPSHPENSNESQVLAVPPAVGVSASHQALSPLMHSHSHQQLQVQPPCKLVNQTQAMIQRSIQQNGQVISDALAKSQGEHGPGEQKFLNNSTSKVGTTPGIQAECIESKNAVSLPSSSSAPPWKAPELLCDSVMPNSSTQMGPVGSPPLSIVSCNETLPSCGRGLLQRQLSGNLPSHVHSVGTQWQQQQSQSQQPPFQPLPLQKQSHQQQQQSQQLIQAGQGSILARPSKTTLE
ncbi:hypothetical protein Ancab_022066 [Ancistrocladus abbreviatus]